MGFVRRLNSRDLVNDPCNGAEVYPITATNAVYREGSGQSLESILALLENTVNHKVVSNVTQDFAHNKLHISYTDNTSSYITYDRLGDFSVLSNTSGGTKTFTISFKKPDNTTVSQTLEIPIVTAEEKQTWNNKSDFTGYTSSNKLSASYISGLASVATSGDYNDLINKPTTSPVYSSKVEDLITRTLYTGSLTWRKWGKMVTLYIQVQIPNDLQQSDKQFIDLGAIVFPPHAVPVSDTYGTAISDFGSSYVNSYKELPVKIVKGSPGSSNYAVQIMNPDEVSSIVGTITYFANDDDIIE